MYTFDQMMTHLNKLAAQRKRVVAIAAAGDEVVLEAVKEMNDHGFGKAILVGDQAKIESLARELDLDLGLNEVINEPEAEKSAELAVKRVREGGADILMKGLLQTKTYLRAILNKEWGLRSGGLLSSVTALEPDALGRLILASDCGMVVQPTLTQKIQIIENCVKLAGALGEDNPKVSLLAAVETVNDNMPDTLDAAAITENFAKVKDPGCIVQGPLSFDLSISEMSAEHKGIAGPVAGHADILIMPNIQAGNIFWKTMTYMAGVPSGATIMGTTKPAVLYSRSDSVAAKLRSIALTMMLAEED